MLRAVRQAIVGGVALTLSLTTLVTPASASTDLAEAVRLTEHRPGRSIDAADVRAALERIGHNPGSTVDAGDEKVLLRWADRAQRIVDTALAQVGRPYRWGGTSPRTGFDCSGLTLYSLRAAGLSVPRTSRAQAAATRAVSVEDMRVGDLVFFGRPVHHVAVYIGNGRFADAPGRGRRVQILTNMHLRRDLVKVGRVDV